MTIRSCHVLVGDVDVDVEGVAFAAADDDDCPCCCCNFEDDDGGMN